MEWQGRRESDNVEDRRGGGLKTVGALSGGGIIIAIIYALLGGDPRVILDQVNAPPAASDQSGDHRTAQAPRAAGTAKDGRDDADKSFVSVVLADTEDVWAAEFQQMGRTYTRPKLVLYDGRVQSACGLASSAVGPFYCPGDQQVYLDLGFFKELQNKLGAQGEFARAYVIAHEIGHHVQNLLGETPAPGRARRPSNAQSVAIELEADCYAGVWAKVTDQAKHVLEKGDIESAVSAAAAVGDDRLQRESGQAVAPDAFTHGSSAQRVAAFKRGFGGGDPGDCRASGVAH